MAVDVIHGDCLAEMRRLADEGVRVQSIVTDPPAGISFMNRAWDGDKGGRDHWIAWMREVAGAALALVPPGGHALVWALPRTSHWTATAWEDAGWDVRDRVAHIFGSGFPKSLDVSKAIDARKDWTLVERLSGEIKRAREAAGLSLKQIGEVMQGATGGQYGAWYHRGGHMFFETGRSLPSRPEWAHLQRVLPIADDFVAVYDAAEREVVGVSSITGNRLSETWRDGSGFQGSINHITAPATDAAKQWAGWGTALKPAIEDWWLFRRPLASSVAENVLAHGVGALNIDATRVGMSEEDADFIRKTARPNTAGQRHDGTVTNQPATRTVNVHAAGRWPANVVTSGDAEVEEAFAVFGSKSSHDGADRGGKRGMMKNDIYGKFSHGTLPPGRGDSGSASRYFAKCPPTEDELRLFYSAKADEHDRAGSRHPTVKPVSLMRWLVRLVTPPGGTVLDCFAGSGTTLEAAMLEGFNAIGIEQDAEHHADCLRRIASVQTEAIDPASMLAPNVAERFAQVPRRAPISELPLFAAVAAE